MKRIIDVVKVIQELRNRKKSWRVKLPKEVIKVIERAIEKGLYKEINNKLIWQYKGFDLAVLANQMIRLGVSKKALFECSCHIRGGKVRPYSNVFDLEAKTKRQEPNRVIKEFIIKHINKQYHE